MFTSDLEMKTMLPVHFRILAEDLRDATFRQYEENECNQGGYCNFMHLKKISRELSGNLFGRSKRRHCHNRSRSCSSHAHDYEEHSLAMFVEEETTTATIIKAGLDAEVQVAEVEEAEAVGEGETGVQLGKSVWIEGQNRAVE
ncbi:splicing factor U2af small subunit B-like [Olea europaea subsp. europaea]|uniref:Splicing factor U2af small subunit B-like n=1 Tax=Olea europaea subsp. europaea TaxID=158383 RepID=A0A8S0STB2_OLEEU|nr:splicing factor U2af small subunit B-like [Olea europaea subsp. europaea]